MIDQSLTIALRDLARRNARWLHWSFVFQRGLVEWGVNLVGTPSGYQKLGYHPERHYLHSEVTAWNKAVGLMDRRRPWSMVNVRLNRQGEVRMARPCQVCEAYMRSCGCREVHYTTDDGFSRMLL